MFHVSAVEPSEEIPDHKSFSGDSCISSEMFSTSNENVSFNNSGTGRLNYRRENTKLGNLFCGEEEQLEEVSISVTRCENSPFLNGFGFDTSKSPSNKSTRKSQRISKSASRTEMSRSISSQDNCPQSQQPVKPELDSLNPEKINSMDESQLRESLQKSFLENSSLLEEVQIKDKAIRRLTECLNDIQVFSNSRRNSTGTISRSPFQSFSMAQDSASGDNAGLIPSAIDEHSFNVEKLALTNQICVYSSDALDEDIINNLKIQDSKTSLFEELSTAIRESRPALEQNVMTGTYIAKDFLVGGSLGWLGAYLLKKFGTTALTAITGGLIVVHLAARKGYVIVNWGEIYKEIEKQSEENEEIKNEMEWITDKVNDTKFWIQEHKYVATSLAVSFIYNIFK